MPGSERSAKHELRFRQGTARSNPMYAHSVQVNPLCLAVCHGTLRLPLRGGHSHVPRPYIDPISLYSFLGVKVLSSICGPPTLPTKLKLSEEVLRTRLTVLQLQRSGADVARAFLQ